MRLGARRWGCESLLARGFSFGAAVALQAAGRVRPSALVTVAPPVGRIIVGAVARPPCPWLVVQGDRMNWWMRRKCVAGSRILRRRRVS